MSKPDALALLAARELGKAEAEQIVGVARTADDPRQLIEGQHARVDVDEQRSLLAAERAAAVREALDEWLGDHPDTDQKTDRTGG